MIRFGRVQIAFEKIPGQVILFAAKKSTTREVVP
jgi:hypothetical protein